MATERWISKDFAELAAEALQAEDQPQPLILDIVIIGSGYGGAIAAAELAAMNTASGSPLSVCVLERGLEYLPGKFPARLSELPGHLRFTLPASAYPSGQRQGLFDLKLGADVSTLVANGLGGGSLINAGVMETPDTDIFGDRWPEALRTRKALDDYYQDARLLLGVIQDGQDNTISTTTPCSSKKLNKHLAFSKLGAEGDTLYKAAISIANDNGHETCAQVKLNACKRCGDCATGCNYGAKESLDTNLLVKAYRLGADIYTGATVLDLDRTPAEADIPEHWVLNTVYTDKHLNERQGKPVRIRARRVILAAGTLGSTEILLRSQENSRQLLFSQQLGRHFSTNGDMIAAGFHQKQKVNAVADENEQPDGRAIGPTITTVIKTTGGKPGEKYRPKLTLEELAVPGSMRRAFEEVYSTASTLHWFEKADTSQHHHGHPASDPFAVHETAIGNTQIYAAMGDDGAQGVMRLERQSASRLSDGAVSIRWPGIKNHPLFESQIEKLRDLAESAGLAGITIANPLWQLLPGNMQALINNQRGPLLTVHPLGGCGMADDAKQGVVDDLGRVFNPAAAEHENPYHEGLVVLDGSIIPAALGTNPALTIAAVSLRAVRELKKQWILKPRSDTDTTAGQPTRRPVWRDAKKEILTRGHPQPTIGEFTERLSGPVTLADSKGRKKEFSAELTLHYEKLPLRDLLETDEFGALKHPVLTIGDQSQKDRQSRIRIFEPKAWHELREKNCTAEQREQYLDERALLIAPLEGSLTIMRRESANSCLRTSRALWAWWRNRGMRDSWQFFTARHKQRLAQQHIQRCWLQAIKSRFLDALRLASHAGEVRLFEYDLGIGQPSQQQLLDWPATASLRGVKRITYARPSNPWRQMMEMTVTEMPGLARSPGRRGSKNLLSLDNGFMANTGIPLFRIVGQENQVEALSDLLALAGYFIRMLFSIHIWNARLPEPPLNEPERLPGRIPGLPEPEITTLVVDQIKHQPIHVRLTRYRGKSADATPVAMFHGYSASGTTFAHHAPPSDIARTLHESGRDIWVVDLRTSCGLPTATQPWTFERVGMKDIPAAIDHIFHATGGKKIDVLAHCMGSVMFSMAVLTADRPAHEIITDWDEGFRDEYRAQRHALPQRIRRVVLSQVGPLVVFSPRNVFSAYVTNYLRYFLPVENYQFRPSRTPGLAEQLMDRLLATLPYPDDEFLLENPCWPPWRGTEFVGTRHRMDAMYGRDFKLANIDHHTLEYIDDFFGPLNPETVSQVIHFNRLQMICNRYGRNRFIFRKALRKNWIFPTLSIHGEENGLSDIATLERMRCEMQDAGRDYEIFRVAGYGHQDCWIGKHAARDVYPVIQRFLDKERPTKDITASAPPPLLVKPPWAGPVTGLPTVITPDTGQQVVPVSLSATPSLGRPEAVVLLPVAKGSEGGKWQVVYNGALIPNNADIPQAAMDIRPVATDVEDWFRIDIPDEMFRSPAEAVMVVTVHDQSSTLTARTFDENF